MTEKTIPQLAEELGEIQAIEDGYYYYFPLVNRGGMSPATLRVVADYLDDKNAVWDEQVKLAGRDNINPMWIEGLKLIDKVIVALQAAGFAIHGGEDGGDTRLRFTTRKAAIETVASVDQSHLFFTREGHKSRSVMMIIPGNGEDAICDHSTGDAEFVRVIDAVLAEVV
jgi:hypothetical protein